MRRQHASPALYYSGVLSIAAVAIAVVLQLKFNMQPCPWCVFQRMMYLLIAIVAVIALPFSRSRVVVQGARVLGVLIALAGLAGAIWQIGWASKSASCAFTLPDKINMALGLDDALPWLFAAPAPCDQAGIPLLGVPFPVWSALLFAALAVYLARAVARG